MDNEEAVQKLSTGVKHPTSHSSFHEQHMTVEGSVWPNVHIKGTMDNNNDKSSGSMKSVEDDSSSRMPFNSLQRRSPMANITNDNSNTSKRAKVSESFDNTRAPYLSNVKTAPRSILSSTHVIQNSNIRVQSNVVVSGIDVNTVKTNTSRLSLSSDNGYLCSRISSNFKGIGSLGPIDNVKANTIGNSMRILKSGTHTISRGRIDVSSVGHHSSSNDCTNGNLTYNLHNEMSTPPNVTCTIPSYESSGRRSNQMTNALPIGDPDMKFEQNVKHYRCRVLRSLSYSSSVQQLISCSSSLHEDINETISNSSEDYVVMEDIITDAKTHNYVQQDNGNVFERVVEKKIEADTSQIDEAYWDIGDQSCSCNSCGAMMWYCERLRKSQHTKNAKFSLCCMQGKIYIPLLKDPPKFLEELLTKKHQKSKLFLKDIRPYNSMFSFTSMGGKVDNTVNNGSGPYVYRMYGQNFHMLGSLLPQEGSRPKFSQLYIYDTDNEVSNRINALSSKNAAEGYDDEIVEGLKDMLDNNNVLTKAFRMARDRYLDGDLRDVKLRLIRKRFTDGRRYNLPTSSEVAALIVGEIGNADAERDIVIESQSGMLKRISELHPSYLALQYPLLFPYGEDGYRQEIAHSESTNNSCRKRTKLTMREFFAFRIQDRPNEAKTLLLSRKLFQQFLVDAYTMIEYQRLFFIRTHQKELRAELYKGLSDAVLRGETDPSSIGRRIILPVETKFL